MTEEKSINIDSRKLFNLGVNLLVARSIEKLETVTAVVSKVNMGRWSLR